LLATVTDGLSTYVQEPLVIDGGEGVVRSDLKEKMLATDSGR